MEKAVLRKLYHDKRRSISAADLEEYSVLIARQFATLPLAGTRYLHIFYPIVGKREVDTLRIADWLRENHPEISLVLSKSDQTTHTLEHFLWEDGTPLAVNSWGITEPESGQRVLPAQLDMVLIPLLVFDRKGNRVGYGKGFYDRFLTECRPEVVKVGLSFFDPVSEITDAGSHDIPLDACITPREVWRFKD